MSPERAHTVKIMIMTLAGVLLVRYSMALVMDQYRSSEMRQMFMMEAVHVITSIAEWMLHHMLPNIQ